MKGAVIVGALVRTLSSHSLSREHASWANSLLKIFASSVREVKAESVDAGGIRSPKNTSRSRREMWSSHIPQENIRSPGLMDWRGE
ncbi:hypothetical protein K504DRAFT_292616 [Pleomassaria siparia CBS 279.74]|uniref:Uncharacterized protein n=1 Tax=Pleomassaria siparia CBS 279.74 TaxID=1314801 RepID=A0A6G1K9B5_9PLEO|nr:hypothetical protein K504DRAFT_292616 [Pleomassaria siparia CBS 279.74]